MADEFGINDILGFKLKRLNDIRTTMKTLLEQVTDPESGESLQVDFDEDDPFIQLMNIFIDEYSTAWELLQIAYGQFNPQIAAGPSLSGLVQLNGILRKEGSPSSVVITLTGSPGLRVPAETQISDENNEMTWVFNEDIYLDTVTGIATATAYSTENGAFNYSAGQINKIVTIVSGLTSVVNADATVLGEADESDADLRLRRNDSTTTPAQSIPESLYGAILNLADVDLVRIYVNKTLSTDGNGIPAKSIASVVVGGEDQDIAETIFNRIGVAVSTYGNTSVTFQDSLGQNNTIYFVRPDEVDIYVEVDISVVDSSVYPADAVDQIKSNIVAFATGGASALGVTETDVFDQDGFLPGEDVVLSKLYTPINAVPGLKINSVQIGSSPSILGTSDIVIDWDEVSSFASGNIGVTVT